MGLVIFLLCGCAGKATNFDHDFNQLGIGTDTRSVKDLLGEPDFREAKENSELWHYSQKAGRYVRFIDGKVTAFGRDDGEKISSDVSTKTLTYPSGSPAPIFEPASRLIGEGCEKDKDCKLGNCHFKVCSGRNNCQKVATQSCATDEECCGGRCDFGHCKIP